MSNAPNPYAWPQGHPNRPPQEYGYAPQQASSPGPPPPAPQPQYNDFQNWAPPRPQVGAPPPSNYWSQGYNYGPEPPRLAPPENINNSYGVENEWRMAPPAAAILPMIEHLGLPPLRRLPKNHRKQRRDMNSIEIYSKWQSK
ncbi:hypothetical protein BC567DRAFT_209866 [Phyllosticta citribraziliensis]